MLLLCHCSAALFPFLQVCPICEKRVDYFIVHMHLKHGPPSRAKKLEGLDGNRYLCLLKRFLFNFATLLSRPTAPFAYVICRNAEGKYLIVEENFARGFWIPAGKPSFSFPSFLSILP